MGFRDGGEDCERFRRACFDSRVLSAPSLLLRSAFADAVTLRDPANNLKLAKARSKGRIDAAAATVLAVAEGARRSARPAAKARAARSEEHTSELQSLMRISYAVFCLQKKTQTSRQ